MARWFGGEVDMHLGAGDRGQLGDLGPEAVAADRHHRRHAIDAEPHGPEARAGLQRSGRGELVVAGEHLAIGADDERGVVRALGHPDHDMNPLGAGGGLDAVEAARDGALGKGHEVGSVSPASRIMASTASSPSPAPPRS